VGKKDFHPVGDPLGDIIAMDRLEGKTRKRRRAENPTYWKKTSTYTGPKDTKVPSGIRRDPA
jgi:hypothetical protein